MTGAFATAVAALSHGFADGASPSALSLGAALVFAGVLGTLLVGRRPSLPRLIAIVAASQLAFHTVFSWLSPGTATAASGHHGTSVLLAPAAEHHGTDPAMWGAHALAMLVTILFLRRAELALWSLLRDTLEAVTAAALPAIAVRPVPGRAYPAEAPRHPVSFVLLSALSRRGPPALHHA